MGTNIEMTVYFDSECNLCNRSMTFVQKNTKNEITCKDLAQGNERMKNRQTMVVQYKGKYFEQSDAVLMVLKKMGGFWALFYVCKIIPLYLRNAGYRFVSKNRLKWFGKSKEINK